MKLSEFTNEIPFPPEISAVAKEFYNGENLSDKNISEKWPILLLLDTKMKEVGWTLLGRGAYSRVYGNDSKSYVVKINTTYDRPYAWFILLTKKFPNIHFPKISSIKQFSSFNSSGKKQHFYMFLMEKLEHSVSSEKMSYIIKIVGDTKPSIYHDPKYKNQTADDLRYQFNIPPNFPTSLIEASMIVGKYSGNYWPDLHSDNIMARANGTIVISDPYSS